MTQLAPAGSPAGASLPQKEPVMTILDSTATDTDLMMATVWRAPTGYEVLGRGSTAPATWSWVGTISELAQTLRDRGAQWFAVRYPLPAWLADGIRRRAERVAAALAKLEAEAAEQAAAAAERAALDAEEARLEALANALTGMAVPEAESPSTEPDAPE